MKKSNNPVDDVKSFKVNQGWSLQAYGSDRRLLFALEPSHGWVFLAGITLGGLLTMGLLGNACPKPQVESPTSTPSVQPLPID